MTSFTSDDQFAEAPAVADSTPLTQDLALVIGARAPHYTHRANRLAWHWPAALAPVPWLLYRKMYLECFAYLAMAFGLWRIFPDALLGLLLALTISGPALYVSFAHRCIRKADTRGMPGARRARYLARAGGISWPGAVLGTLMTLSIAAYVMAPRIFPAACSGAVLPC